MLYGVWFWGLVLFVSGWVGLSFGWICFRFGMGLLFGWSFLVSLFGARVGGLWVCWCLDLPDIKMFTLLRIVRVGWLVVY